MISGLRIRYTYKGNEYERLGDIQVKNVITREWEEFVSYKRVNDDKLCAREKNEFEALFEITNQYKRAIDKLDEAKVKCISNIHRNESGVLWESLWKFENGMFKQKTCASDWDGGWYIFTTYDQALHSMIRELDTINSRT